MRHRTWLVNAICEQYRWIEACGGTLQGYLKHYIAYGREASEAHAIYLADTQELKRLQGKL